MKKWLYVGTVLLIFQLALTYILHSRDRDFAAFKPNVSLLNFSPDNIDTISIIGENQRSVQLRKVNGKWILPGKFEVPADENKIVDILNKLASLKQGLVVAKTTGASKRFKVSESDFVRHIVLKNNDKEMANFFLGTSPRFKMVHARISDKKEIVSVELNTCELEIDSA